MAGMFFTADASFASFGVATMTVVAVAMLGSLTVLPALLSKLGDKVDRGRVPFVHRLRRDDGEGRIWGAIIDRVLRRPLSRSCSPAGCLVALAVPAFQLHTAQPSIDTYPQKFLGTYNRIKAAFPGTENASVVVVKASERRCAGGTRGGQRAETARARNRRHERAGRHRHERCEDGGEHRDRDRGRRHRLDLEHRPDALRDDIIPATVGALPATEVAVTGMTASTRDFTEQMRTVAPLVFGFVLLFAFGLMLVSFRSVVIAAKAVLLNLLSVGAAYGILVLVFQHGWGKGLLGFEFTGGIDPFLPILLFVILFGLSMDYHVFILSRIREAYDRGMTTDDAIAHGIKTTAGVVTSAAIVMVGVFAIFATLQAMILKQFGVGLAAAILIDATIVRAILLPATMKLLGDWNWYLPKWLEWLPHFEHGGSVEKVEAPPAPAPTGLAPDAVSERSHHRCGRSSRRTQTGTETPMTRFTLSAMILGWPRNGRARRSVRAGQADGLHRQPGLGLQRDLDALVAPAHPARSCSSATETASPASRPDWATSLARRRCDRTTTSRSRA